MDLPGLQTTEKIPVTLLQPYLNNGHVLFTDNFYTTPRLAHYLLQNGTGLVDTVRPNRKKFPKALAFSYLEKGEAEFYYANDEHILAVKYRATKDKSQKKGKSRSFIVNGSLEQNGKFC